MRKLSLDDTWDYTKRMWKRIAFQKEVLKDKRSVTELKRLWIEENATGISVVPSACFFCTYSGDGGCSNSCPASLVEPNFNCCDANHHYDHHPGAFYREILRLDAIRTAVPPEPVVVAQELRHGDYGYYLGHKSDPCVVCNVDDDLRVINNYNLCCFTLSEHCHRKFDCRGNIFDDLKDKS